MNSHTMIWRHILMLTVAVTPMVLAQVAQAAPVVPPVKPVEVVEDKPFTLDSVIAPVVKKLAEPQIRPNIVDAGMVIATPSEKASLHVKQGFALVHAQWDFEAYRHFCVALQEDPDCLMAYVGVSLALARPHNEYVSYRRAAVDRILDLMEADKIAELAGKVERFPAMEKEFAAAVATLVSTSPRMAGALFHKLGVDYPHFTQAQLLALFLSRGGYDITGDPTPGQWLAIKRTRSLLEDHPDDPKVLGFWLTLNAEAPLSALDFKKDLLPAARKLVEIDPTLPCWQYLLGHYEWRVGNYREAQKAFAQSADLYSQWMKKEGVSVNDCEGYLKAKAYLVNALYLSGDFEQAMKIAMDVRALKADISRPQSAGNAMLLWLSYNQPARLYMARGAKGDMDKALKSLPGKKELGPFAKHKKYPTLAGVFSDALAMYLGSRKAMDKKDRDAAISLHRTAFRKHIMDMATVSKGATQVSDYAHFIRAGSALSVYDMELAGLIAMKGPEKTKIVAAGRFLSARDKQRAYSVLMPPIVMNPMDNRLGEYYFSVGESHEALLAYTEGDRLYPNNLASLLGMKRSLLALEKNEEAEQLQKRIDKLTADH